MPTNWKQVRGDMERRTFNIWGKPYHWARRFPDGRLILRPGPRTPLVVQVDKFTEQFAAATGESFDRSAAALQRALQAVQDRSGTLPEALREMGSRSDHNPE